MQVAACDAAPVLGPRSACDLAAHNPGRGESRRQWMCPDWSTLIRLRQRCAILNEPVNRWAPHPTRANSYDQAILAADRRAWHPLNVELFDLSPFDIERTPMLPPHMIVALETSCVSERLTTSQLRARFTNETVRIHFSDILLGERAAMLHAIRLCGASQDLGAQENAANQVREEARHVAALTLYIARRWGEPVAPTPVFAAFLDDTATSGNLAREIAGMQVLLEGLAMGIFAALEGELRDPLGKELIRLVMADEASHLKTGVIWMENALRTLSAAQSVELEAWTAHQFTRLSRGLLAPMQHPEHYARFGIDPRQVVRELRDQGKGRQQPSPAATIFRTVAKAVQRAGLISPRSAEAYAGFL
jgi:hypothetical protein